MSERWQSRLVGEAYDVLAPDGSEIRLLVQSPRASMVHCTLPAGETSRAIRHRAVDELWYFLTGEGNLWRRDGDEAELIAVRPGVAVTIPAGVSFQFRATGDEALTFVITTAPPWPGNDEAIVVPPLVC